jgi:hypothetical protein
MGWLMLTVTLGDLVIHDHPNLGDYWLDEEGITWPGFPVRRRLAPESEELDGDLLLGFARGSGQMSLTVYTHGSTLAEVRANMLALEAATYQYEFEVTISLTGMADEVYQAMPALPLWGDMDSGEVRALMVDGQLVIPLNPPVVP